MQDTEIEVDSFGLMKPSCGSMQKGGGTSQLKWTVSFELLDILNIFSDLFVTIAVSSFTAEGTMSGCKGSSALMSALTTA